MSVFSRLSHQVKIRHEDRELQFRPEDITVKSLSRIFHLIPETIILISEEGIVSIPDDHGKFEVDDLLDYKVEGDLSTVGTSGTSAFGTNQTIEQPSTSSRWKPKVFPLKQRATAVS